jgi:hypothetical protein
LSAGVGIEWGPNKAHSAQREGKPLFWTTNLACDGHVKKIKKLPKSLLTPEGAAAYIRLTNEGGAPLATRKFALVNGKIKRAA